MMAMGAMEMDEVIHVKSNLDGFVIPILLVIDILFEAMGILM